jgi:hypothetical protein
MISVCSVQIKERPLYVVGIYTKFFLEKNLKKALTVSQHPHISALPLGVYQ